MGGLRATLLGTNIATYLEQQCVVFNSLWTSYLLTGGKFELLMCRQCRTNATIINTTIIRGCGFFICIHNVAQTKIDTTIIHRCGLLITCLGCT